MASFYDVGKENTNALKSAFNSYESLQDFLYEYNSVERHFLNFAYDMDSFVTDLKELTCLFSCLHYLHLPKFHGNMIKNLIIMIKKSLSTLKTACGQTLANIYSGYTVKCRHSFNYTYSSMHDARGVNSICQLYEDTPQELHLQMLWHHDTSSALRQNTIEPIKISDTLYSGCANPRQ